MMAMAAPVDAGTETPSAVHVGEIEINASVTVTFALG
jgi:hypothetical protein